MEKIVLAYSGGLDTTAIIPWLKENYQNAIVIACCVDVGQVTAYPLIKRKALETGADEAVVINARAEFVSDYIFPMLKANAIYEDKYLLGTAIARPLIAKKLVETALSYEATAICHGATGKGNDQIRFELTIKAFAPMLKVIAPWRLWSIKSREDAMEYLKERGISVPMKQDQSYSRDENLWHISHEGLELENPDIEPDYRHILKMSVMPQDAPAEPENIELYFEKGIPVKLNGEAAAGVKMVEALNEIGGRNGIGITDLCENRVVGMKSRGIYETPGGTILYFAHRELEHLCLDRKTMAFKDVISGKMAELIYSGEWFTPLREALGAFVEKTQETVTGTVKLKLYKGNIITRGSSSPFSLYSESLSSFTTGELYNHQDAEGFINLFSLPVHVRALMQKNHEKEQQEL
ncbi:MAG: argininosuccinate synthase [Lachnospiraceae bacterium]|nr:argininosuccinate synthase [Lachnospiraceae bacterium]